MYVLSIVNGSALTLRTDESGNLIGYYVNNTVGAWTEMTHPAPGQDVIATGTGPHLTCVNMTMAIGQTGGSWQVGKNTVRAMNTGEMWSVALPNQHLRRSYRPSSNIKRLNWQRSRFEFRMGSRCRNRRRNGRLASNGKLRPRYWTVALLRKLDLCTGLQDTTTIHKNKQCIRRRQTLLSQRSKLWR